MGRPGTAGRVPSCIGGKACAGRPVGASLTSGSLVSRRRLRLKWILALVVLLALGGVWAFQRTVGPRVPVVAPRRGPVVQTLAMVGRVASPAEVRLTAREPAAVTQVPVQEGDHVEAGALLVQMDDDEARALVMQAEASLAQAEAALVQVRSITSKTAAAELAQARAQLEEAERVHARDQALFQAGTLTAAEADQARTELTVARSRERTAELQAAAVSKRGVEWQAAVAARMFAEAGLLAARERVERLQVLAPAAGVVTSRAIEVGEVVQPGADLVTLVLDGPRRIIVEPDERNLASLRPGQRALAAAEAFPERTFDTRVEHIAPAVDPLRGTIEVWLRVLDPPELLRTDMTVSVDITIDGRDDALTLPAAVVRDLATDAPWVLVVEDGRAVARPLELGLRGDDVVEVRAGLDEDDRVIGPEHRELAAGERLRPVEPEPPAETK